MIRVVVINSIIMAALLALVEVGLRLLGFGYGNAALNDDPLLHHVHPVDYSYLCYDPSGEYGGHEVVFGEKGFRVDETAPEGTQSGQPIWFIGDSFAEAAQVSWAASYPGKTVAALGGAYSAKNMGVPVYSPLLEFLQLKKHLADGDPKPAMAIIQVCWDDASNDDYFVPATTFDAKDEPVKCDGGKPKLLPILFRKSYIFRAIRKAQMGYQNFRENQKHPNRTALDLCTGGFAEPAPVFSDSLRLAKSIQQMHRFLAEKEIPHYFLAIPSKYACLTGDWDKPSFASNFNQFSAEKGLPFIDLIGAFKAASAPPANVLFYDFNYHVNEKGHEIIAQEIVKAIREGRK